MNSGRVGRRLNIMPQRSVEPTTTSAAVNCSPKVRPGLDRLGQHVHHRVEVAIAEHAAARLLLARESPVGDGGLDAAGRKNSHLR